MSEAALRLAFLDDDADQGDTTTRTVDMHVSRVRKVLGLSAAMGLRLTAIYGYGYRLEYTGTVIEIPYEWLRTSVVPIVDVTKRPAPTECE
jgi:hypothetical protein